nr:hypothetical protein [Tanacetum cinerariifolium]
GEVMINCIKNGDQPLPRVTQVSIAGTSSTEQPPLKDKSMCNKTPNDLWDALARHMLGSEYGEQDRKAVILYENETFKATKEELLLDTYFRYLQKQYATMMRLNKNLMDINIDALYNILKQNQGDVNDAIGLKKKNVVVTSNPLVLIAKKTKKVISDSEASSSSADDKISENDDLLAQKNVLKDQLQVKHVMIDTHVECQEKYVKLEAKRNEYMIRYSAYFDNDKQHKKQIDDQEVLYDKMSVQLVELDKHVRDLKNTVLEKDFKISELEKCVRNKDLEIEKHLERFNDCENKLHKIGQTNQTVHMIMPSKDKMYNGRKGIGFENLRYFCKAKDLKPMLYDERVINLGYTLMFLTHSDEALKIEKFKRARENKIEFAYDYGNLNASYITPRVLGSLTSSINLQCTFCILRVCFKS